MATDTESIPVEETPQVGEEATAEPLFNRIGASLGIDPNDAVSVVAGMFVDRLVEDEEVKHFFAGMDKERHKKHLSKFISLALGKPGATYNFSKEGIDNLTAAHAKLGITEEHFGIVAGHLQSCLTDAQVPEALVGEAMAIVGSTKDAVINAPAAETATADTPVVQTAEAEMPEADAAEADAPAAGTAKADAPASDE